MVNEDSGQLNPLALADGKTQTTFADFGSKAFGQAAERGSQACRERRSTDFFFYGIGALIPDIVGQCAAEDGAVGGDDARRAGAKTGRWQPEVGRQ